MKIIAELRAIIPPLYIPPFLRNQFAVEEVVREKKQRIGRYAKGAISDCRVLYQDGDDRILIHFQAGTIWLEKEAPK